MAGRGGAGGPAAAAILWRYKPGSEGRFTLEQRPYIYKFTRGVKPAFSAFEVPFPAALEVRVLNRLHQVVGEGFAGRAGRAAGDDKLLLILGADVERHLQLLSLFGVPDVCEQNRGGADHAGRVGVGGASLLAHAGGRA